MWFTSRWRLALVSGAVALSTAFGVTASSADSADDYTPWPGLPKASELDPTRPGYDLLAVPYSWLGLAQVGRAGSIPGKQWARIPINLIATQFFFRTVPQAEVQPPFSSVGNVNLWNFFVSPKGSEHAYGDSAPITVRTVAFGAIPAEVTIQVVQRRLSNGTPEPIVINSSNGNVDTGVPYGASSPSSSMVLTRVTKVKVDGVSLDLGTTCQTAEPGALKFEGTYQQSPSPTVDMQEHYDPAGDEDLLLGTAGGQLSGTVDIGRFAGCRTTAGDDISPLLTSAISGPGNPLRVRLGVSNCFREKADFSGFLPPPPGAETPEEGNCVGPDANPTNPLYPKYVNVPTPMDFPTYAPGDTPAP